MSSNFITTLGTLGIRCDMLRDVFCAGWARLPHAERSDPAQSNVFCNVFWQFLAPSLVERVTPCPLPAGTTDHLSTSYPPPERRLSEMGLTRIEELTLAIGSSSHNLLKWKPLEPLIFQSYFWAVSVSDSICKRDVGEEILVISVFRLIF